VAVYEPPLGPIAGQVLFYNVYPRGQEDDIGDLRWVDIPVGSVSVTGASGATADLTYPGDYNFVIFDAAADRLRAGIATPAVLNGKRILGIDVLYQAAGTPGFALEFTIENNARVYGYGPLITGPPTTDMITGINSFSIGEVNPFWNNTADPNTETSRYPWRYQELSSRFLGGLGAQPLWFGVRVDSLPPNGTAYLGYLALRIYFCDETRVLYGGTAIGDDPDNLWAYDTPDGISAVTLRTTSFQVTGSLSAADYTVTASLADAGDKYNAGYKIRLPYTDQLNKVITHPTYQVDKFKRMSGNLPPVPPEVEPTDFMVPAGLRTSGGATGAGTELQSGNAPVTYTMIWGMPVYSSITAIQQIHNMASASDTSYEYVRFYARRFNEEGPGDLQVSVAGSGSATITAAEFAALPVLSQEGWKEVTLPIAAVFSSDASFRNVTFTMVNGSAARVTDQYQIMTVLVRNPANPTTGAATLSLSSFIDAIYDGNLSASLSGQFPNNASNTVDNNTEEGTAILLFSQAPPMVTGFGITEQTQELATIGNTCDNEVCIPSALSFHRLSWTAPSVTGYTAEIQRNDSATDDWQQIYLSSSMGADSFDDYEARVGLESQYRIRLLNSLDFQGTWVTGAATLTAPGVTVGGDSTGNSVLILTTNHGPTGNLAYVMQFEGDPQEEFTFIEAGWQQFRPAYRRDYLTAMRPSERGGEQFTRTILVHDAAIPVPSLGNFRSLRDLGWADLPYVCVRDELGNRWFANILIPSGRVRDRRTTYLAQLLITEVTGTAAPVGDAV
jgi:hypothetical protein